MMRRIAAALLLLAGASGRPALEKPNIVMLFVDGKQSRRLGHVDVHDLGVFALAAFAAPISTTGPLTRLLAHRSHVDLLCLLHSHSPLSPLSPFSTDLGYGDLGFNGKQSGGLA